MPCTACGSAPSPKDYQLSGPKPKIQKKIRILTQQQAAAYRAYLARCSKKRHTLVFN